jgi:hypothetical protein
VTVYVDDWRQRAVVGRTAATWSHLFAGPWDVTEPRRQAAIAAGAVPVTAYSSSGNPTISITAR